MDNIYKWCNNNNNMIKENNIKEFTSTRHIEVMKAFDFEGKLYYGISIYDTPTKFGPYELKGNLLSCPFGVEEITLKWIYDSVGKVYTMQHNIKDEVDKLITKLKNKKWLK